jgi:hypothetical protein
MMRQVLSSSSPRIIAASFWGMEYSMGIFLAPCVSRAVKVQDKGIGIFMVKPAAL